MKGSHDWWYIATENTALGSTHVSFFVRHCACSVRWVEVKTKKFQGRDQLATTDWQFLCMLGEGGRRVKPNTTLCTLGKCQQLWTIPNNCKQWSDMAVEYKQFILPWSTCTVHILSITADNTRFLNQLPDCRLGACPWLTNCSLIGDNGGLASGGEEATQWWKHNVRVQHISVNRCINLVNQSMCSNYCSPGG